MQNLSLEQMGMSHPKAADPAFASDAYREARKMLPKLHDLMMQMPEQECEALVRRMMETIHHNKIGAIHFPTESHGGKAGIGHVVYSRVPVTRVIRY